jgi:hypothetical protein
MPKKQGAVIPAMKYERLMLVSRGLLDEAKMSSSASGNTMEKDWTLSEKKDVELKEALELTRLLVIFTLPLDVVSATVICTSTTSTTTLIRRCQEAMFSRTVFIISALDRRFQRL